MGIFEFFLLILVVALAAALTAWAIGYFAPGAPPIVVKIVWGVAVLIIIVALLQALGLIGAGPQIPRLR